MTVLAGPMGAAIGFEAGHIPGYLLFTGCTVEPPACVMDAFTFMEAAAQALKPGSAES